MRHEDPRELRRAAFLELMGQLDQWQTKMERQARLDHRLRGDIDVYDFLAWAESKPPSETFSYLNNRNCAIAQYLRERGICRNPFVTPTHWEEEGVTGSHTVPPHVNYAAHGDNFGDVARLMREAI